MSIPKWQAQAADHLWMPYCQMKTEPCPLPVVSTAGVHLHLADGRQLIDGLASWWTACHGYNHPHLVAAVQQQAGIMPHVMMGGVQHPQAARLATRLAGLLPGSLNRVFFVDSGSVAIEAAMKMAVQYHLNRGDDGRTKFLCFRDAYHGDTTGAMSLCDPETGMHAHFKGFLLRQYPRDLPVGSVDETALDQFLIAQGAELAGIIIEPLVQGAGGMRFHSAPTLQMLRRLCDRHQLLLIADEIATGFGRTGTMFASEQAQVVPDIICIGKALTGGMLGLAAAVATDQVYAAFHQDQPDAALMHGPTFMGNPLACAAANASLDLFECEPRLEQAQALESLFLDQLGVCRRLPQVRDVRARGAIGVIQFESLDRRQQLIDAAVQRGIWVRPFRDMVYLTPALNIGVDAAQRLCHGLVQAVFQWCGVPDGFRYRPAVGGGSRGVTTWSGP